MEDAVERAVVMVTFTRHSILRTFAPRSGKMVFVWFTEATLLRSCFPQTS